MIFGKIDTFISCGLASDTLIRCLDILRAIPTDAPCGRVELENGIFYTVMDSPLSEDGGKLFETHNRYTDIQYILSGCEQIIYDDKSSLVTTVPYSNEKDIAFHSGNGGTLLTLNAGDFVVFTPTDAHACGKGNGFAHKVVMKIPV
jgi:YhcH/YjgK/YiaL family protein